MDTYFVCLDTGASSHSHPESASLKNTAECLETKYTGGGPSDSKLEGVWEFSLTDVHNNVYNIRLSNTSHMPKLPLPIISETCLEKCGWIWDNVNSKLHLGHLTFNTFEKYGVKGINVGKLVPGKILMFSSTNISNVGVVNRSVPNVFPKA